MTPRCRKMRILLLTLNPNLGASARSLQDWLLLGQRHELSVSVLLRQAGELSSWLQKHQIPHRINSMPWFERFTPWRWIWATCAAMHWARSQRVDLIHCYEHELYPFAWSLSRLIGCALVCHCHFLMEREYAAWAFGMGRKSPCALIWTSHQQQQDCAPAVQGIVAGDRQHIIPLGLDLERFGRLAVEGDLLRRQWGIPSGTVVVGAASALRARKRIDDFIDLVTRLRQRNANVVGVLAGGQVPGDEAYASRIVPLLRAGGSRRLPLARPLGATRAVPARHRYIRQYQRVRNLRYERARSNGLRETRRGLPGWVCRGSCGNGRHHCSGQGSFGPNRCSKPPCC